MSTSDRPQNLFVTPYDRRADIWVVTLLCLSISTLAVAARWTAKLQYRLKLRYDDYVVFCGYVLALIQHVLLMVALTKGLGLSPSKVPTPNLGVMAPYLYSSQIFWICSMYSAKCCMMMLLRGLFEFHGGLNTVLASFVLAAMTSILTVSVKCSPNENLLQRSDAQCSNRLARWIIVTLLDIITEITIFSILFYRLQSVRMPFVGKMKISIAFSTRLSVVAFSILFVSTYARVFNYDDPTLKATLAIIFQQCSLASSLTIVAILPCFRVLFQSSEIAEHNSITTTTRSRDPVPKSGVGDSPASCRGNDVDRKEKLRRMSSSTFVESSRSA